MSRNPASSLLDLEEPEENVDTAVYEVAADEYEDRPAGIADGYEYVDDSSGLEAPEESDLQVADSLMDGAATPVRLDEGRGGERP